MARNSPDNHNSAPRQLTLDEWAEMLREEHAAADSGASDVTTVAQHASTRASGRSHVTAKASAGSRGEEASTLARIKTDGSAQDQPSKHTRRHQATRRDKPAESALHAPVRSTTQSHESPAAATDAATLLTTSEAAALLHVHPRTVQRLVERGELDAVHLGGAVRFDRQDVTGLVARVKCARGRPAADERVRAGTRVARAIAASSSFRDRVRSGG